jgi:hypothetical protein
MQHLSLAGVSEDGRRLLLVNNSGQEFTLDIEPRLRAALRGEHARIGQLEIQMDSTLRPRDIQARIRAGETPESVAQAAHTTVEKILPFANPVLAERVHVTQRAQRSSVRRKTGDVGVRTLGDAVAAQLRALNVDPGTVQWDAWRREDGRWQLTATYAAGRRKGTAHFAFDAPGNFVLTENDEARWLVGDGSAEPAGAPEPTREERDDLKQARQRRLIAVPEDELPLGDDAIELANQAAAEESTVDLTETASRVRSAADSAGPVELAPTPEPLAEPAHEREELPVAVRADEEPEADEPPRRAVKKSRGRASVPSWDEIMFGGGKSE